MPVQAESLLIAVAANFAKPMKEIVEIYQQTQLAKNTVKISTSSTGKHFAQIKAGAPFDAFFSADNIRPKQLETLGIAKQGSRFIYAKGQLVLLRSNKSDQTGIALRLDNINWSDVNYFAIANHKLAPYGQAAEQVLDHYKWRSLLTNKLIRAENINQVYNFVKTGHVDLALVARSQLSTAISTDDYVVISPSAHTEILQSAVSLNNRAVTSDFMNFFKTSDKVKSVITKYGYL